MNDILFSDSIKQGAIGEDIFKEKFLDFLHIKYIDVTGSQAFQAIDTDYQTSIGQYEIKTNYRDNDILIFEDYTNINQALCKISLGWIYKTKADIIVFISKKTHDMIFLPFTDRFKAHYKYIRNNTKQLKNKISTDGVNRWQSAFRIVPFDMLEGFISIYKKV